jgi:hypothetical protein
MDNELMETQSGKTESLLQMFAPYLIGGAVILPLMLLLLFGSIKVPVNPYDEGIVLVGATQIMAGKVPYRDFWTIYSPGQFYTLAVLFRIFGTNVMVERVYDRLIIMALIIVTYSVECMVIPRNRAVIVAVFSAVFLSTAGSYGYPVFPALLSSVLAFGCLLKFVNANRRYWLFLAGVFVGITALFRHDFGAYAGGTLAATLLIYRLCNQASNHVQLPSSTRELFLFVKGGLIALFPLLLYLALSGALRQVWRDLFVFTLTVQMRMRHIPLPGIVPTLTRHGLFAWLTFWGCVSALGLSTVVVIDTIWSTLNKRTALGAQEVGMVTSTLFGLFLLAQAMQRFDWIHLLPSFFFALLAGAGVFCNSPPRSSKLFRLRMLVAVSLIAVALPGVLPLSLSIATIGFRPPWRCYSHLGRAACTAIESDEERAIDYILARTRKDEYIFVGSQRHDLVFINDVIFYFLADRPIPVAYDEMDPGQVTTAPVQEAIVDDLRSKEVRIVVLVEWPIPSEPNCSSLSSGVRILDDFIHGAYDRVVRFRRYEIWQRR